MLEFFKGKKILLTGHTGFKGSWLSYILIQAGAEVTGYALEPPTTPSLFHLCGLAGKMRSVIGDIRDYESLRKAYRMCKPEIVIHMAAQPLVRESYIRPRDTYETNVMGTVNLLECVREDGCVRSFLNVTTDKVYQNKEWVWGYRENERLDGADPYSNSKSCSELVTHCYKNSFLDGMAISTARAGNVIGGGDFAADRIIPDCIRAVAAKKRIQVRNPQSIRPYQHVLEALSAYLMILEKQYESPSYAGYYNVGPDDSDCMTTGELVSLFCRIWGEGAEWNNCAEHGPHESNYLKLDCSLLKRVFAWQPKWPVTTAVEKVVAWSKCYLSGESIDDCMSRQIKDFWEN